MKQITIENIKNIKHYEAETEKAYESMHQYDDYLNDSPYHEDRELKRLLDKLYSRDYQKIKILQDIIKLLETEKETENNE